MKNRENFWTPENVIRKQTKEAIDDFFNGTSAEEEEGYQEDIENSTKSAEEVSEDLRSTDDFLGNRNIELEELYNWYASAMKRRDREPLDQDRFLDHFFNGLSTDATYMYGEDKRGYLLGFIRNGVFVPTHFAPRTLKGGYLLLEDLANSENTPTVLAITKDLAETIRKMKGWQPTEITFQSPFRDGTEEKEIVFNSHPETSEKAMALLREYVEN